MKNIRHDEMNPKRVDYDFGVDDYVRRHKKMMEMTKKKKYWGK